MIPIKTCSNESALGYQLKITNINECQNQLNLNKVLIPIEKSQRLMSANTNGI